MVAREGLDPVAGWTRGKCGRKFQMFGHNTENKHGGITWLFRSVRYVEQFAEVEHQLPSGKVVRVCRSCRVGGLLMDCLETRLKSPAVTGWRGG